MAEVAEAPAPQRTAKGQFTAGHGRLGGRARAVANRDRTYTVERINETADPIGLLCRIANGEAFEVAPELGSAEVVRVRPTMADRLLAARTLAAKVLPDLKSVSIGDSGNLVTVMLNLAPSATATTTVVMPPAPAVAALG